MHLNSRFKINNDDTVIVKTKNYEIESLQFCCFILYVYGILFKFKKHDSETV